MKKETQAEFVSGILRKLVCGFAYHPDNLVIEPKQFHRVISIKWTSDRGDFSRIVGTSGATFSALKDYVRLVGLQMDCDVDLERLDEPTVGVVERYPSFKPNPNWPKKMLSKLLEDAVVAGTKRGMAEVECGDLGEAGSAFMVKICKTETLNTETVLRATLSHIFKVIGNSHGRIIKAVDVMRDLNPEPDQPKTSRGRYAEAK